MRESSKKKEGVDEVAERYDTLADAYDERFQSGHQAEIQNDIIFSTLNEFFGGKQLRILDAGGGTGFYSIPLASQGHDVVILDKSRKMLEIAESKARKSLIDDKVKTIVGNMNDLKEPDESFDVVLCHLALCYVSNPSKTFAEFSRVLRRSGILSLVAENKAFFSMREAFRGNLNEALQSFERKTSLTTVSDLGRLRTFERKELLALIKQAKLKPVKILGLRIASDYLSYAQKAPAKDYETLRRLEYLLSKSSDWNSVGRFHFIICKKT